MAVGRWAEDPHAMTEPPTLPNAEEDPAGLFAQGVRHWNARDFYEAHEAWEELWLLAFDDHKRWLQGLIQYAAAFVHFERGFFASGFRSLMARATTKVAGYTGPRHGLDEEALQAQLAPWIAYGRDLTDDAAFPEAPAPLPTLVLTKADAP